MNFVETKVKTIVPHKLYKSGKKLHNSYTCIDFAKWGYFYSNPFINSCLKLYKLNKHFFRFNQFTNLQP